MSAEADHQHETLKDAIRAGLREGREITTADVSRAHGVGFWRSCAALESLEAEGVLAPMLPCRWRVRSAPRPETGYGLALSAAEHGALLRLLDAYLSDRATLLHSERLGERLGALTEREAKGLVAVPLPLSDPRDTPTLRAIRSRLKRPAR